ncbi:MAG: DUF2764 family protein [Victivallaceae bacterium]|nr:DUF2764 family protein [Victivallaceae bacterium]
MYTFLLASLPSLEEGKNPPLSVGELDAAVAAAMIPEDEAERAAQAGNEILCGGEAGADAPRVYREYAAFERNLRAHIARIRSGKKSAPAPCAETLDADTASRLTQAASMPPPERERAVDFLRFRRIDEIAGAHVFDFDALCAYRLRLLLLAARSRRDLARGRDVFTELLNEKAAMA